MHSLIYVCFFVLLGLLSPIYALSFKDTNLENGTALNPIKLSSIIEASELHGDMTATNLWIPGQAGSTGSNYTGLLDYRLEHHLSLYNKHGQQGSLITRIQGIGFIDQRINSFLDDPIIDIPELFYQNRTHIAKNKFDFVFGKFANRRFYGKDEIYNDPFDIGEMRFAPAQVNMLNIFAGINDFRDGDLRTTGTREASGSYGFHMAIKNEDVRKGFFRRWGYEQAFAVAQLNNFQDNFYGISEINKDWGDSKPSRATLGLVYANQDVFRITNNNTNNYLIYAGYFSRPWKKFSYHMRYGTLFREMQGVSAPLNEYRIGCSYKLSKKDNVATWLGYFDGKLNLNESDNAIFWIMTYKHSFNDHLSFIAAMSQRFNQFNSAATGFEDNAMTFFTHLQTVF